MMDKLKKFWSDSKQEFKRVNWPTKEETVKYTLVIIGMSLFLALFLGFFDMIFLKVIQFIIQL